MRKPMVQQQVQQPAPPPGMWIEYMPLDQVRRWPRNPKRHDEDGISRSFARFGFVSPIIRDEGTGCLVAGHGRLDALVKQQAAGQDPPDRVQLGPAGWLVPVIRGIEFGSPGEAEAYVVADNQLTLAGGWDQDALSELLRGQGDGADYRALGFTAQDLDRILGVEQAVRVQQGIRTLAEQFLVPPFSVLDARQGYWQSRKDAWLSLGIQSEVGRGQSRPHGKDTRPAELADGQYTGGDAWKGFGKRRGAPVQDVPDDAVWRISAAWASKRIDCTPAGIAAGCRGACCKGTSYWPSAANVQVGKQVGTCIHLGPAGCKLDPADKPVTCLLYPFKLSRGLLGLHGRALIGVCAKCYHPDDPGTPTIAEAIRQNFVELFGQQVTEQIMVELAAGRDARVVPPEKILGALTREMEWEQQGVSPSPRRQADQAGWRGHGKARAFSTDLMKGEDPKWRKGNGHGILGMSKQAALMVGGYQQPDGELKPAYGTSVFDPVLCELVYRWFCPPGGHVLDPFAGGSVRGVVAAMLGRRYTGVELRDEQVDANKIQWRDIRAIVRAASKGPAVQDRTPKLTPVEEHGGHLVKRDDLYAVSGVRGGKVRTCWALAQGSKGLVTAGSRASPQVNIVAQLAARLRVPCRVHVPTGDLSPEVQAAQQAGAEVVQHRPGYNTVIVARAQEDAVRLGWTLIPFGMECEEAVKQTAAQVRSLPADVPRIVIPVGSGMSLAGVLHGLLAAKRKIPVVGVVVGADPAKRLDRWAPPEWRTMVELIKSDQDYHQAARQTRLGDLQLDPIYEAKCLPHLRAGDLLWCVGIRQTAAPASLTVAGDMPAPSWQPGDCRDALPTLRPEYDLVFTCPPYADLEVYSDDPRDLSTMQYPAFREAYRGIIAAALALLKPDRFAAIVVGEARGRDGTYYGLVPDTVRAFEDAGAHYYNEGILVTPAGSLPVRAGKQFSAARKLGKTHQNVLLFVKGDVRKAVAACGLVEVGAVPESTG